MPDPIIVLGASSGFGLALANRLTADGELVTGAARSARPQSATFDYRQVDATDDDSVAALVEGVRGDHGVPKGLVYAASSTDAVGNAWELTSAELAALYEVTVFGFVRAVRHIAPLMIDSGRGSIVLVGSRAARVPVETLAGYASAKAAVEHYAHCLAEELGPKGVRVNIVGISADTPLAQRHLKLRADVLGRTEPYPPLPAVEDNLPAVRFLLSPDAAFVNGQTIEARQPLWT